MPRNEDFNIHEDVAPGDLRDRLGWWNHSGEGDTPELVSAIMILCARVAKLEAEIERLEKKTSPLTHETKSETLKKVGPGEIRGGDGDEW